MLLFLCSRYYLLEGIDDNIELCGLYCGLLEGSEFDINLLGGGKKSFEAVNLLGGMRTREVFNRRIGFNGEVEVSRLVNDFCDLCVVLE